jgi:hypothetical protein
MTDPRDVALARLAAALGRPLTPTERARTVAVAEAAELSRLRAAATPPEVCGPEVPAAPGRGAFRVVMPERLVSAATGRRAPDGYLGRAVVVVADVWDAMDRDARARYATTGKPWEAFVPPFLPHQVAAARTYRAVAERLAAGGLRCASMEARGDHTGVPGRGGASEALLADARWMRRARVAVGDGFALRRRGGGPGCGRPITLIELVDRVAIGGLTPSAVLRKAGWAHNGRWRRVLRQALADALDRISQVVDR